MSAGSASEINVTPMIDVLLVLLIIFMVIQPTTPKGLDTSVPQPPKSPEAMTTPERTIVLSVQGVSGAPPVYRINGTVFPRGNVEPELNRVFAVRQDKVMFLKGDPQLDFASVAEAVGMGQQANARVGLLTPQLEAHR